MTKIIGKKGGKAKSHTPVESPDSLHSLATAKILIALGEGEFAGGIKGTDIYFDGTPLETKVGNTVTTNFPGVTWTFRSGAQTQNIIPGLNVVDSENPLGLTLKPGVANAWLHEIKNKDVTAFRVRLEVDQLFEQFTSGDRAGDMTGFKLDYKIELRTDGGAWGTVIDGSFNGKTTTVYERSHRINLPTAATGWDIRITRITPDDGKTATVGEIKVAAYTDIIDAKLTYPNTAMLFVTFNAKQFQNIPQISVKAKGRIVRIPKGYDPDTRTYPASWDGTFVWGYTNNPAWCFYDILLNKTFGLGDRITASMVDQYELYNIAHYCDEMVEVRDANGNLTTEPRFMCDVYIQSQNEAFNVLRDLASIFRGMTYWAKDQLYTLSDKPRDMMYVYTRANVIDGKFTYASGSERNRYSTAMVSWSDPDNHYADTIEPVAEQSLIARYGIRQVNITAIGCTRRSEANRRGRWALLTNSKDRMVSFGTGLDGFIPLPGYIIGVADEMLSGVIQGGRIRAVAGKKVTLDRLVTVQNGVQFAAGDFLKINLRGNVSKTPVAGYPNAVHAPETYASYEIASITNNAQLGVTEVTLKDAFTTPPEPQAVWALEQKGTQGVKVQQYRVLSVTDNDDGTFGINAVYHNPSKFDYIDSGARLDEPVITAIPDSVVAPPTDVKITSFSKVEQTLSVETMRISWKAVPGVVYYDVQWRKDHGDWQYLPRTSSLGIDVPGIYTGVYTARVRATNVTNVSSVWANSADVNLIGKTGKLPAPTSLTTKGVLFGIELNWSFSTNTGDVLQTTIQYATDSTGAGAKELGHVPYPQATLTHSGLAPNVSYWYRIKVKNRLGIESDFSAWVKGTSEADITKYMLQIDQQIKDSATYKQLNSNVTNITNQTSGLVALIDQANQDIADAKTDIVAAKADIVSVDTKVDDTAKKAATDLTAAITQEVKDRNAKITGDINTFKNSFTTTVNNNINAIKLDIDARKTEIEQEVKDRVKDVDDAANAAAQALANAQTTLNTSITNTQKQISTLRTDMATAIASVAAGTGEQFDALKIWYFDKDGENWTEDDAGQTKLTTSADGWLKMGGATATGRSPNDATSVIDSSAYKYLRLRIRKVGNPHWAGKLWWVGHTQPPQVTNESGWTDARSKTIPEPTWDPSGVAVVSLQDIAWQMSDPLRRIRLDLATGANAQNTYEIDWLAVGRPTPGAGMAAVESVRNALSTDISQEAKSRNIMIAQILGNPNFSGNLGALKSGLLFDEMTARVNADQTEVNARKALEAKYNASTASFTSDITGLTNENATRITEITALTASLGDKATVKQYTDLKASVDKNTQGISTQNNNLTALTTNINVAMTDLLNDPGNLLFNPSFELPLTGVGPKNWVMDTSASYALGWSAVTAGTAAGDLAADGTKYMRLVAGTKASHFYQEIKLIGGRKYRFSCRYRFSTDATFSPTSSAIAGVADANNDNKLRLATLVPGATSNHLVSAPFKINAPGTWKTATVDYTPTTDQKIIVGGFALIKTGKLDIDSVSAIDATTIAQAEVNTNAITGLTQTVKTTQDGLKVAQQDITSLQTTVTGLSSGTVTKNDFTALTQKVDANTKGINTESARTTSLETAITAGDNLVPNPYYLNGAIGWTAGASKKIETKDGIETLSSDADLEPVSPSFVVKPGDVLECSADLYAFADVGNVYPFLRFLIKTPNSTTSTTTDIKFENAAAVAVNSWKTFKGTITVPANAISAVVEIHKAKAGRIAIANARVSRLSAATSAATKAVSTLNNSITDMGKKIQANTDNSTLLQAAIDRRAMFNIQTAGSSSSANKRAIFNEKGVSLPTATTVFGRGYNLIVFSADASGAPSVQTITAFDTYGNNDTAANAQVTAFNDAVKALADGTQVAVVSFDEPSKNRDKVAAAIETLGGTAATVKSLTTHSAYILIGRKGLGAGQGKEYIDLAATSSGPGGVLNVWVSFTHGDLDDLPTEIQATAYEQLKANVTKNTGDIASETSKTTLLQSQISDLYSPTGANILNPRFMDGLTGWAAHTSTGAAAGTAVWAKDTGDLLSDGKTHKPGVTITKKPNGESYIETQRSPSDAGRVYRITARVKAATAGAKMQIWLSTFPSAVAVSVKKWRKEFTLTTAFADYVYTISENHEDDGKNDTYGKETPAGTKFIAPSIYAITDNSPIVVDSVIVEDITATAAVSALATSYSTLSNKVSQQDTKITAEGKRIDSLDQVVKTNTAAIATASQGTASQFQTLTGRVTTAENTIKGQTSDIAANTKDIADQKKIVESSSESITALNNAIQNQTADPAELWTLNPSFDSGLSFWRQTASGANAGTFVYSNAQGHTTKGSAYAVAGKLCSMGQNFFVKKGHKYTFSAWTMFATGSAVSDWGNTKLRIGNAAGAAIATKALNATTNVNTGAISTTWAKTSLEYTASSDTTVIVSVTASLSSGSLYVDDFSFIDNNAEYKDVAALSTAHAALNNLVTDTKTGLVPKLTAASNKITSLENSIDRISGKNIFFDPSFEISTTSSLKTDHSEQLIDHATDQTKQYARTGTKCFRFWRQAANGTTAATRTNQDAFIGPFFEARTGQQFEVSGYFRQDIDPANIALANDATAVRFGLHFQSDTVSGFNDWQGFDVKIKPLTATWTKFSGVVHTSKAGASKARLWVSFQDTGANFKGVHVLIDDVSIIDKESLTGLTAANTSAIDSLDTRVEKIDGPTGSIHAINDRLTRLDSSITDLNTHAGVTAITGLTTRLDKIDGANGSVAQQAKSITQLNTDLTNKINGKVDNSVFTAANNQLTSRVSKNENDIKAEQASITNLTASITAMGGMSDALNYNGQFLNHNDANDSLPWWGVQTATGVKWGATSGDGKSGVVLTKSGTDNPGIFVNNHTYFLAKAGDTYRVIIRAKAGATNKVTLRYYHKPTAATVESPSVWTDTQKTFSNTAFETYQQDFKIAAATPYVCWGLYCYPDAGSIAVSSFEVFNITDELAATTSAAAVQSLTNTVKTLQTGSTSTSAAITELRGSITASQTLTGELIPNPDFVKADGFTDMGFTVVDATTAGVPAGCPTARCAKLTARDHQANFKGIPVTPGDTYEISVWVASGAGTVPFSLYIAKLLTADDPKPTAFGQLTPVISTSATWQHVVRRWTVPATGISFFRPFLQIGQNSPFGTIWYATSWHCRNVTGEVKAGIDRENALKTALAKDISANASALNQLKQTVEQNGKDIAAKATAITNLESSLTGKITTVQNRADKGVTDAAAAAAAAKAADTKAGTANTAATNAAAAATAADNKAGTANTAAANAAAAAKTADGKADTAAAAAKTADTKAGTAQTAANAAKTAADNAATAAAAAQQKADGNAKSISELTTRVTATEKGITAESARVDGLESSIEAVNADIMNLVANGSFEYGKGKWELTNASIVKSTGNTNTAYFGEYMVKTVANKDAVINQPDISLRSGRTYKFGIKYRWEGTTVTTTDGANKVSLIAKTSGGDTELISFKIEAPQASDRTWKKTAEGLFKNTSNVIVSLRVVSKTTAGVLVLDDARIEDWTANAGVAANANEITSIKTSVTNNEKGITAQATRLNSLESSIDEFAKRGIEILTNPGFENNATGWTQTGSTHTIDTAQHHAGGKSLKHGVGSNAATQSPFVLRQGRRYKLQCWVKFDAAARVSKWESTKIRLGDASYTPGPLIDKSFSTGSTYPQAWTNVSVEYVPVKDWFQALVTVQSDLTAGNVWIDDVSFMDITDANSAAATAKAIDEVKTLVSTAQTDINGAVKNIGTLTTGLATTNSNVTKAQTQADKGVKDAATAEGHVTALTTRVQTLETHSGANDATISNIQQAIITEMQTQADAFQSQRVTFAQNSADIADLRTTIATSDSATSQQITQLNAKVADQVATVETTSTAIADLKSGLQAQWGVKVATKGSTKVAAGIQLGIDGSTPGQQTSKFLVAADTFAVVSPNGADELSPFIITGGKVYINDAMIRQATITTANIADAAITNAKIGGDLQSASWNSGHGWRLEQAGTLRIKSSTGNKRVELDENGLRVYDDAGTLRVRVGTW
ncbi:TPA: carbohydrate binding domain-containing protein [Klebsiella variicola subsp. variicola]|nr:carbohydrate binding domain-containing protein [Klebsiella variicola subsp. variicola]